MTNSLIDKLMQAIDAKHREALKALETLQAYLEDEPLPENVRHSDRPKVRRRAARGSIRDKVLSAFRRDYLPVREVVTETGLTTSQVRGVVNAPDLKGQWGREEANGLTTYKFVGNQET